MHKYGMKYRGYSIGCQPSGVLKVENTEKKQGGFYNIIYYELKLPEEQEKRYELKYLGEEE